MHYPCFTRRFRNNPGETALRLGLYIFGFNIMSRSLVSRHIGILSIEHYSHAFQCVPFRLWVEKVDDAGSNGEPDDVAEVETPASLLSASQSVTIGT